MRKWILALALLSSQVPAALAGGIHARIEGPGPDGTTYVVRTLSCNESDALEPWASAEGVVDGHRRSVLIHLQPTSEHGVYRFSRTWSNDGAWMIRVSLGHPPAPATVATLRSDGSVARNKLYYRTDGYKECHRALKPLLAPGEEDC